MSDTKPRMKEIKLFGGPLDGRTIEVPASTEAVAFGPLPNPFWTYTYAGKDGRLIMFAKQPKSRKGRRFVWWFVGKFGRDPRIDAVHSRGKTVVGRTDKHGQGAKRRAAKRAAA